MTRAIATVAGSVELAATPLGPQELKGFLDPIELFQIDPCVHPDEVTTDPACGMRLSLRNAIDPQQVDGRTVGFCSARCAEIFRTSERFR